MCIFPKAVVIDVFVIILIFVSLILIIWEKNILDIH